MFDLDRCKADKNDSLLNIFVTYTIIGQTLKLRSQ